MHTHIYIYIYAYTEDRREQARLKLKELRREPRARAGAVETREASGGRHHTESWVSTRPLEAIVSLLSGSKEAAGLFVCRRRLGEIMDVRRTSTFLTGIGKEHRPRARSYTTDGAQAESKGNW